jgi:hypothetical protein
MKTFALLLLCFIGSVQAKDIAWMPNQANGKIVLTDEICKDKQGKTYKTLNRMFLYSASGSTMDGCFYVRGEIVDSIWDDGVPMRYPIGNFTLYEKQQGTNL